MKRTSTLLRTALVLSLAATAAAAAGCGGDSGSNTTGPPPPGKELNSGSITPGHQFAHPFSTAGTFNYKCTIHPSMTWTVTVNAAEPAGDKAVSITDNLFTPSSVTVAPGNSVVWTNNGAVTHTVTTP